MPARRPSRRRWSQRTEDETTPSRPTTKSRAAARARTTTSPMSAAKARVEEDDEDEDEASLSLAAMEAELRRRSWRPSTPSPTPTRSCASCRTSRSRTGWRPPARCRPARTAGYKELKDQLIKAVKSLSLNQNRIEALVEQLYDINKRLVQNEGRLLRLAESYGVAARSSSKEYQGSELDPNWMKSISQPGRHAAGRSSPRARSDTIRDIRGEIQNLATETGDLDRRIPPHRQPGAEGRARSARSPRRKWSRPTCASSSRSPRNTPTAACSSSI